MHLLVRPIVDALAPADGARALRRTRNAALWLAGVALLAPRAEALATGMTQSRYILAGTIVAYAAASHFLQKARNGPWIVAGVGVALGVAASVVTGALWGVALGLVLAAFLAAATLRQRAGHALGGRPADSRPGGVRRLVAGLAAGFAGTMIFTTFAVMPIHVPTGSMEPTIYGASAGGGAQDFILVDRFVYQRRDPRRWEIAVFEFPLGRSTNFVKRIVGLPGETVEIRGGDIWVGGRIARKSALVQESLWRGVYPRSAPTADLQTVASAFKAEDLRASGGWSRDGEGIRGTVNGDAPSWFGYDRNLEAPDVRVGARLTIDTGAAAHFRIISRGTPIVVTMRAVGKAPGTLTVGDDPPIAIPRGVAAGERVELSTAEGVVRVTVDGVEVATAEAPCEGSTKNSCALGVSGGKASFHRIRVERDVVYVAAGTTKWEVPAGHYVALGDNSGSSEDSRAWTVTEIDVRGEGAPLRTAATVLTETGGRQNNLALRDDKWTFTDVNGVPRRVPRADVTSRRTGVPAPFVPRDHMLGRAVVIYWPWTTDGRGGFRPRILP